MQAGVEFDRQMANDIFQKMDEDEDELVTFEQFAFVYIEAEERLSHRIADYRDRKVQLSNEIRTWKNKLREAQETEKLNQFGTRA